MADVGLQNDVWNSSGLMEQGAVVQFLTLKKLCDKGIRAEIEGVYGHEALSLSAAKDWCRPFTNWRINLDDDQKSEKPHKAISASQCEPLSGKVLLFHATACEKFCIAKATCLPVLTEHFGSRKEYFWCVTHLVTHNEAHCRITFCEGFLQVMRHARETSIDNL
jgi:hypothetical protein